MKKFVPSFIKNIKNKITQPLSSKISQLKETHPKKYKIYKIIAMTIGGLLVSVVLFFGIKSFFTKPKAKVKEETIIKVKVAKLVKGDFSQKYPIMGTIKGTVENDLRFEVEGALIKYNYKEGARIAKGNIIGYLNSEDAMTKISYAKTKYESEKAAYFSAQQRLNVYEDLYRLKSISESKLLETQFEVEATRQKMNTALVEVELAQSNLLKTNLFAPSSGILAEIVVQPGEFVTPNDVVARFVSVGDANLEVEIPEKDVEQIDIGLNAKILSDSYPNKIFDGVVSEIAPIVKEKTRTVVVKIRISNPEGLLRSGMFARGDIFISEASNIIAVVSDSIVSLGEETKLLPMLKPTSKKQNQGIVELRQIKIGGVMGKLTVIADGVDEGELYITETSGELSDGILAEYMEPQ